MKTLDIIKLEENAKDRISDVDFDMDVRSSRPLSKEFKTLVKKLNKNLDGEYVKGIFSSMDNSKAGTPLHYVTVDSIKGKTLTIYRYVTLSASSQELIKKEVVKHKFTKKGAGVKKSKASISYPPSLYQKISNRSRGYLLVSKKVETIKKD